AKVNFDKALALIQEIGSPSEILQAMDLPIEQIISHESSKTTERSILPIKKSVVTTKEPVRVVAKPTTSDKLSSKLYCTNCNWPNEFDSRFCENCGRRITEEATSILYQKQENVPQEIITHPFLTSFLISYLILIILGNLILLVIYSDFNTNSQSADRYVKALHDIPKLSIIPAIFISLISGYFISQSDLSKKPSRYEIQLARIQNYYSFGVGISLISLWWLFTYLPFKASYEELFILVFLLAFCASGLAIWFSTQNRNNKSMDASYLVLLRLTKIIDNVNRQRLRDINIRGAIIISVIVFFLWQDHDWFILSIPAWIAYIFMFLFLLNGVVLMHYYSWSQINRFVASYQQSTQ
ncbi:MAG: zinc ribbon domain-containing protein, partial [Promethearchaeota archaeon]